MASASLTPDPSSPEADQSLAALHNGTAWFFWIAGLSLVNAAITRTGSDLSFVVGLGATQVIDALAIVAAEELPDAGLLLQGIGLALSLGATALFALFGWLGRRQHAWAIILGMVLYALDGLLFVFLQSWLSVGFHVFALVAIFGGLRALFALRRLAASPLDSVSAA